MHRRLVSLFLLCVLALQCLGVTYVGDAACETSNLAEAYRVLKANGLSDVSASAIVGNISSESGGDPACVESGPKGKGIGLFQLSNDNRQYLEDYCAGEEHATHPKVVLSPENAPKSYEVCNVVSCQIEAMLPAIASTINARNWSGYYNTQVQELEVLAQAVVEGALPAAVDVTTTWKGFKAQTDLMTATLQFQCDYETPSVTSCFWVGLSSYKDTEEIQNGFIGSFQSRYNAALTAYNTYSGKKIEPQVIPVVLPIVVPEPVVEEVVIEEVPVVDIERLSIKADITMPETVSVTSAISGVPQAKMADKSEVLGVKAQASTNVVVYHTLLLIIALCLLLVTLFVCISFWCSYIRNFMSKGALVQIENGAFSIGDYMLTLELTHVRLVFLCTFAIVVDCSMLANVVSQLLAVMG